MASNLTDPATVRKSRNKADTFPLFLCPDGRRCKKIRGKHRYFGYDKEKALDKYQREIGLLRQGLEPQAGDIALRQLFNTYLTAKQRAVQSEEMGAWALSDSNSTLRRVLAVSNDRLVSTLTAADFATVNTKLGKGRSIITFAGDIRRTKAAFNWALREGLIPNVPRFGNEFKPAPRVR